jgi:hypothetical protein
MLSSGIDLRTAAGRLGHSGGGSVTLRVYAHRTRPTDQRAAELLAEQLRGIKKPGGRQLAPPGKPEAIDAGQLAADRVWVERLERNAGSRTIYA